MVAPVILTATKRDPKVRARDLRKKRQIPAEYYGAGQENVHLVLDYQTFRKIYHEAGGSSIIDLNIKGEAEPHKILIHEISHDPVTDEFQHVDLMRVDMQKKITTNVPIHLEGESLAVKNLGGILTQNKNDLSIRCLPENLIKEITVDIGKLEEIGDSVRVADLKLDAAKYELGEEADAIVCAILAPKTEEEIEEELAEDVGGAVSEEVAEEAEAEKAEAEARKEGDAEKKGSEKDEKKETKKKESPGHED
ncbi:MAG: 50S ribosomal protein L25 [Patescibacteria group bacterium]